MVTSYMTVIPIFLLLIITVRTELQLNEREKRQNEMEIEEELKKTTTDGSETTEENLIFKKEEDDENSYDDATLHDIDKRSPGGHKRKSAQEGNAAAETAVNDATSTTEPQLEGTDEGENEVENDTDDIDANSDYDGQTSEQTSEDQNDYDGSNTTSQSDQQQTDEAENYEADFDVPNEGSKTKHETRTSDDNGKREKRFAKQMIGPRIGNDDWMMAMRRIRPQRHVNLADAVVIRVKRLSRAGSSHKKNKLNERRGNTNRGDDAMNTNSNAFTNDGRSAQNTR